MSSEPIQTKGEWKFAILFIALVILFALTAFLEAGLGMAIIITVIWLTLCMVGVRLDRMGMQVKQLNNRVTDLERHWSEAFWSSARPKNKTH